jgi:hypothetical protein
MRTALFEAVVTESCESADVVERIPRNKMERRRLSAVELTLDVDLISLISRQDLAAIGQDEWLITTDRDRFTETRRWAHQLRVLGPWAHGIIWRSRRSREEHALMLFGDRCDSSFLRDIPERSRDLNTESEIGWLNDMLAPIEVESYRSAQKTVTAPPFLPG